MKKGRKWYKLDNAAIIIPPTTKGASTRVFRIVCELKEDVDPDFLQEALDQTIRQFPHFNVVLRKGLFWYYMDASEKRAVVEEDHLPACAPLYFHGRRNLLYRVTYFHRRINLEMFHVLADGTGAFVFMRRLVATYLSLKHGITFSSEEKSTLEEKKADAFEHFYRKEKSEHLDEMMSEKAYQLPGTEDENLQNHLLEVSVSASDFVKYAKSRNTTAGVLCVALYIRSILRDMSIRDMKRKIVISVPVNLRSYFPSDTTRNFYGTINIPFDPATYDETLECVLNSVSDSFKEQLQPEAIRRNMNSYSALEHNIAIKAVPLFLKDLVVSKYSNKSAMGVTGTMSNLGRISMPDDCVPYIEGFSAFMAKSNMQVCVSTFNDNMIFGSCSNHTEHTVMHRFITELRDIGLSPVIAGNDYDAVEEVCSTVKNVK